VTFNGDFDDRALADRLAAPPPPPAADLLAAVKSMAPVRPRSRFGPFLAVAALGLIAAALAVLLRPLRRDLGALPVGWVVGAALLWLAGGAAALATALVPRRGDVLPAAGLASRVGVGATVALLLFALLATVSAPGISLRSSDLGQTLLHSCIHCLTIGLPIGLVFLLGGFAALRRSLPMGARRIGIALGAAGGAIGGLALHFKCPIADTAHVVLAHAGGMVLSAIGGALLLPWLLERRAR
jgi:hypothetical protein